MGGVQSDTPVPLQKIVWRRRAPGLGEGSRGEGPHFRPADFLPRGRVSETSRLLWELAASQVWRLENFTFGFLLLLAPPRLQTLPSSSGLARPGPPLFPMPLA